jgi:AraC-like DNA-binding protein
MLYVEPALMIAAREEVLDGASEIPSFSAPVFADERLRHAINEAFAAVTQRVRVGQEMVAETALLRMIALLTINLSRKGRRHGGPTISIRKAKDRIDADPAGSLSLASLAAEAGASRYQLLRAFARELGLTPHAYIVQQRLALARRLIRAGSALVDAASAAGFSDQSHLTRVFARQFGVTPARYRLCRS